MWSPDSHQQWRGGASHSDSSGGGGAGERGGRAEKDLKISTIPDNEGAAQLNDAAKTRLSTSFMWFLPYFSSIMGNNPLPVNSQHQSKCGQTPTIAGVCTCACVCGPGREGRFLGSACPGRRFPRVDPSQTALRSFCFRGRKFIASFAL